MTYAHLCWRGDPFGLFDDFPKNSRKKIDSRQGQGRRIKYSEVDLKAMICLGVPHDFTPTHLHQAYRALVKKHHPDVNNGSKSSEEMLKKINQSYAHLKNSFQPD